MTYTPPIVTVDLVLLSFDKDFDLSVLLIERASNPFKNMLALPGGYVAQGETALEALSKKILKKTGVEISLLNHMEQLYTFDAVGRDPRGHAISITWYALCEQSKIAHLSGENPAWYKVKTLKETDLSFDHREIIQIALDRLKDKIWYSNIVFALVPEKFSRDTIVSMYHSLDEEASDESIESFLEDNDVIKEKEDGYSIKIRQLVYYKK